MSSHAPSTSDAAPATITGYKDAHGDTVFDLGPYRCTNGLALNTLAEVLVGYFQDTSSRLTRYTNYLVLNLHVAANESTPDKPASTVSGDQLPSSDFERVGGFLKVALREFLYSPVQLAKDRKNLNESWYQVDPKYMPITEYFTVHKDKNGKQSTPDGWPPAKYLELADRDRVLLEYGSVDPQLADYDLSQDQNAVFPSGYLTSTEKISAAQNNATLASGCLYHAGSTGVSQSNSSWAISSRLPVAKGLAIEDTMGSLARIISDIIACGISPMLNTTLFSETTDASVEPYRNVSLSTGWAWAIGEPREAGGNDNPKISRCAIMDVSLNGRWRATNCAYQRRAACRVGNSPFSWTLSDSMAPYANVSATCPSGSTFAVPRTALENTYLYKKLLSEARTTIDPTSTDPTLNEIFLDFNSIDVVSCWVNGGPDAICPYEAHPQQLERRTALIAAIAGIVICIITALTLFVKCNANRRNSSHRKRVIEGWEYEGVPS